MIWLIVAKVHIFTIKMDQIDKLKENLSKFWHLPEIGHSEEDQEIIT